MNKIFLAGVAVIFGGGVAVAQETDMLFPELMGQFQPAPTEQAEQADAKTEEDIEIEEESVMEAPIASNTADRKVPEKKVSENRQESEDDSDEKASGNLVIQVQNVDGVLPYARTLAYCTAEAVLVNETNARLEQLSVTATYKDMPKDLNYSNVSKGKKRTQKFMLIGLPCESINGMPAVEVKTCKLGKISEEACKKKVQFIPPSG